MSVGVTPIKYEWQPGFPTKLDPEIAGRELDRIAKRDQEVVPIVLIEESRPVDAPLHSQFEWDDTEAATLYREDQAKRIIRAIRVVYVRNDTEEPLPSVRAYVSVVDDPKFDMYEPVTPNINTPRHYRPIAKVMSDHDLRDQYVGAAFNALVSWRERYRDIEQFATIFERIDALRQERAA